MQCKLVHSERSRRLVLIFAGVGADDMMAYDIDAPGYDVMVVWDYSTLSIDWQCVERYEEICIFAWSIGVYVASQTTQAIDSRVTLRVAVNGTIHPIDSRLGVSEEYFYDLLDSLDERRADEFFGRMCCGAGGEPTRAGEIFNLRRPSTSVCQLRAELESVADRTILDTPSGMRWDMAFISTADRLFPRFNQLRAWEGVARIRQIEGAHCADLAGIVGSMIVDKKAVELKHLDCRRCLRHSGVQIEAAERLARMIRSTGLLPAVMAAKNSVIEAGCGAGVLTRIFSSLLTESPLIRVWDMAAPMPPDLPIGRRYDYAKCDPEVAIARLPAGSVDHIFSGCYLHLLNSPERFLMECRRVLRPGGCVFLTVYTAGSLHEMSDISSGVFPLLSAEDWLSLAGRSFEVVAREVFERDLDFEAPADILRHVEATERVVQRVSAEDASRRMVMRLDGRYHLTYRILVAVLKV